MSNSNFQKTKTYFEPVQAVAAGRFEALLEPGTGQLRTIRWDGVEIVRAIYCAVRDHNWDTIEPQICDVSVGHGESEADSVNIDYRAVIQSGNIDFDWTSQIRLSASGLLTCEMRGEARSSFRKNRIGFCLLHPLKLHENQVCHVTHSDGSTSDVKFPDAIAPHQPMKSIKRLEYEIASELNIVIDFVGDVFEMEDQRNWTDASYKTYCTPLDRPFPVTMEAGEVVEQRIAIHVEGVSDSSKAARFSDPQDRSPTHFDGRRLPKIGVQLGDIDGNSPRQLNLLKQLNLDHLRVDLSLARSDWADRLRMATAVADELSTSLEAAVFLAGNPERELAALRDLCEEIRPPISSWLVFREGEKSTKAGSVVSARRMLESCAPKAAFVGGTDAYFAELNRQRPDIDSMDGVNFSINPQVHASDGRSIVETLEAQDDTIDSAKRFCDRTPIYVSPITLKPRFNPNATGPEPNVKRGELPPQVDRRQCTLFAAGWTLGSIAQLASAGASHLTYYETVGWRGVMESCKGSPLPGRFPSYPDSVYPVFHVFADLGEFAGAEFTEVAFGPSSNLWGIALRRMSAVRVMIANLNEEQRMVHLPVDLLGTSNPCVASVMDPANVESAMLAPAEFRTQRWSSLEGAQMKLEPFAIAVIDCQRGEKADA